MITPNDMRTLTEALRAMAADDAELGSNARVEHRLRAEVRGLARTRRRRRMTFATLAAGLTLVLAVPLTLTLRESDVHQPAVSVRIEQPFLATPYAGSFTGEGQIVRLEVPVTTLRALGVAAQAPRGQRDDARVLADVLIGEDGVARAIRFVGPVSEVQR